MKTVAKNLIISLFFTVLAFVAPVREAQAAAVYTDSITFKIDSAKIVGNNLVFSIMFYRHIDDWRGGSGVQDTLMGDVDLYFWANNLVLNDKAHAVVSRKHPNIDHPQDFLKFGRVGYHAGRFHVKLAKNNGATSPQYIEIPYNTPVELCQLQLPLNHVDRNPGFRWDTTATGGFSNRGEPLLIAYKGDIIQNPDPAIVLEDYAKKVHVCEGDRTKIWAKGYSAGTLLNVSWLMSKDIAFTNPVRFTSNIVGTQVGTSQVHYSGNVTTPDGALRYEVSSMNVGQDSRVDTLMILDAPQWLDSMYFQCILTDPSLSVDTRKSVEGETQVIVRDSVFGWFAASDANKRADVATGHPVGASNRTDTVMKCPTGESYISFYFFGPDCGEDAELIGNEMTITYMTQDALANRKTGTVSLTSWAAETVVKAPNGRCLFRGTVNLPDTVTDVNVWVTSISTAKGCHNGAPYTQYDTVHIRDIEGNVNIKNSLVDMTVSSGEKMKLNTDYVYSGYELKTGLGSSLELSANPKYYQASSTPCTNPDGCADTITYKYDISTASGTCTMEIDQIVHISDWYYVAPKVFLEGPYNKVTQKMNTLLVDNGFFNNCAGNNYCSPYDNTVIKSLPVGKNVVDWVEISLRDINDVDIVVTKTSGLLLDDGTVCDTLGNPYVYFKNIDKDTKYYVVVNHRNHLLAKSANTTKISSSKASPTAMDFTQEPNVAGGKVILLDGNISLYGLYAGAVRGDIVISGADSKAISDNGGASGYINEDANLDGVVDGTDRKIAARNSAKESGIYY